MDESGIRLRNCPFHHLVGDHLDLVCALNRRLARRGRQHREGRVAGRAGSAAGAVLRRAPSTHHQELSRCAAGRGTVCRDRCSAPRQTEDLLAEDVVLDLVRAAGDRLRRNRHEDLGDRRRRARLSGPRQHRRPRRRAWRGRARAWRATSLSASLPIDPSAPGGRPSARAARAAVRRPPTRAVHRQQLARSPDARPDRRCDRRRELGRRRDRHGRRAAGTTRRSRSAPRLPCGPRRRRDPSRRSIRGRPMAPKRRSYASVVQRDVPNRRRRCRPRSRAGSGRRS